MTHSMVFPQDSYFIRCSQTVAEMNSTNLARITNFPSTRFITNGDEFFRTVWNMIDTSKHYFWITTYAMDSSPAADTTLMKLRQAAQRGVHVVVMLDNVQAWAKKQLVDEVKKAGGKFILLNPQFSRESIKNYINKDVWRRHHEKLIVSDSYGLIGSSNIQGNYADIKYGNCAFEDINYLSENIILDEYRQHFVQTADSYGLSLIDGKSNQQVLNSLLPIYPNSNLYPQGHYRLLHNDPRRRMKMKEIEQCVLDRVEKATKSIAIVQPYHYPMFKFDIALATAAQKGINCQIITTGKRDQPVFKSIFNYMLFGRLIRKGVQVRETRERLLHSKIYLFDDSAVSLGSMNNDRWSWKINNEVNILIKCPRDVVFVRRYVQMLQKKSKVVKRDYKVSATRAAVINFWQRFLYLSEIVMGQGEEPEENYIEPLDDQAEEI